MTSTTFVDQSTPIVAAWLNDVNTVTYSIFGDGTNYTGDLTMPSGKVIIARAGTVLLPSYTFNGDLNTGFYQIAADNIGAAVAGAKVLDVSATGLGVTGALTASGVIKAGDGTVGAPGLTFESDTSNGLYRISANKYGMAAAGAKVADISSAGFAIKGTNTNDDAAAGFVGEYTESVLSAGTNFPSTGVWGDFTSLSLTAGDWDVTFTAIAGTGGATVTEWRHGISTTSGNSATGLVLGSNYLQCAAPTAGYNVSSTIASYRMKLNSTTTIYAKYLAVFTVSTPLIYGRLSARRVR